MNTYKNARLSLLRRQKLVRDTIERRLTPSAAGAAIGVSAPTARTWLGRYLTQGTACLRDASSRPWTIHARIAFALMKLDERRPSVTAFLNATVARFAKLGVTVRRILTDNGSAFRSKRFARGLSVTEPRAQFHAAPSTADQWQSRTLPPIGLARVCLLHPLRSILGACRQAHSLDGNCSGRRWARWPPCCRC